MVQSIDRKETLMTNQDYNKLKTAHDKLLSAENVGAFDKLAIRVVSSKIEEHPKYGLQCVIILQPENGNGQR